MFECLDCGHRGNLNNRERCACCESTSVRLISEERVLQRPNQILKWAVVLAVGFAWLVIAMLVLIQFKVL
jgi:hypothetical protein